MDPWTALRLVAEQQHGLVTVAQASEAGIPPSTVYWSVRHRGLALAYPDVVALPGSPDTPARRAKAVELALGPPALIAGWSAAYHWGLVRAAPSRIEVLLPAARRAPRLERVEVHRTRILAPEDRAEADGIALTSPARTLVTIAGRTTDAFLRGLVIDARQRRLVDLADLRDRAAGLRNAPGTARVRRVLAELDTERPDSVFEHRVRTRLRRDGLHPDPEPCAVTLRDGRILHVDVPWSAQKVGLECDGLGSHQERAALDLDALRHNGLADVHWQVLRVTWTVYGQHWPVLLAQLRRLLGRHPEVMRPSRPRGPGG